MSKGDINSYLFRMLDRLLIQKNVPKEERPPKRKELFELLKDVHGLKSFSKASQREKWEFCVDCERLLIRDFGYFVDDNNELKFEDENIQN